MEIAASIIEASHNRESFELHHVTDTHIEDSDHAEKELAEKIQLIADNPNARWIGGGDYGSLILPSDPRFQTGAETVHRVPDMYVESVVEMFKPIADKCVGFGTGNHEQSVAKFYHRGVGAEVAMQLGIPHLYLGVRGWIVLQFKLNKRVVSLKAFQYHGWSAGRQKGRKAMQAERDLGAWNADVFFLGHDHVPYADIWWTEEIRGTKNGFSIHHRPRAVINGGAWLYGQRKPLKGKAGLAASQWPNELWVEGKNFRPQAPASPVLLVHVDFGSATLPEKGKTGRAAGFDFEIRQRGNRLDHE